MPCPSLDRCDSSAKNVKLRAAERQRRPLNILDKMLLHKLVNNVKRLAPNVRGMASQGPLVDLTIDNNGISIMTMQRPPVNSLNLDLLRELSKSLDEVDRNKSRGLILTSSSPTVFSAGLDVMEMYKPDFKRVEEFCTSLQDVWFKLFGSSFVTAAAINGHSPAGGCLLAMSCEYRVMVQGKFTIGLNETALGIVAPTWVMDTICHAIPVREAEYALTTARMFTVDEALKVRLVDESAADKEDAINKCKNFIMKFERIPPLARSITKQKLRQAPLNKLQENRKADCEEIISSLKNPKFQQSLEMYV